MPLTGRTLASTFGPSAQLSHRVVAVLAQALAARASNDRPDTLYREWRRALDVVYGDLDLAEGRLARVVEGAYDVPVSRSVGELLFVLHTYFALVARLLAVEILATSSDDMEFRPTAWRALPDAELLDRLGRLDRGDLPGGLDIANLFEADLFSWWLGVADGNSDLLAIFRDLLAALGSFAFPRVVFGPAPAGDVLRDLYQALVPRELRRALGEFLTPTWLAGACLESLATAGADLTDGRVLDPTCGTGTFLMPILTQRVRRLAATGERPGAASVQAVLDTVCGVDLNPVAVTAARVNFVVALGDLAAAGPLTLPVWRADSLLVPDAPSMQGDALSPLAGLTYRQLGTSLPEPFPIPASLATAARLARLRALLEDALIGDGSGPVTAQTLTAERQPFLDALDADFGPDGREPVGTVEQWNNDRRVTEVLYDLLADLAAAGRNGVWVQLIENAFAPLFAGTFDVVVGNPPWLTWTKLPDLWRRASRAVWQRYGLWRVPAEAGGSFSLASTDVATLVFAVALDRYVGEDGFVALLTPDSLLIADPAARAFRQFRLRPDPDHSGDPVDVPFALTHADDWSQVRPFAPEAANRPVFLVARRGQQQLPQTPARRWFRTGTKRRPLSPSWSETRPMLAVTEGHYEPVDPRTTTSAWSFRASGAPPLISGGSNGFEFGVGLYTRGANGIYFCRLVDADRRGQRVLIENLPEEGRNRSVSTTTRGWVESVLVYPLLRGRDVQAWTARPSLHFLLPHEPENLDRVLTDAALRQRYPNARSWLRRHNDILKGRAAPPTRSWRMDGDDWCRVDGALGHMAGEHLVVVREQQARPAAAVAEARMDYDLNRRTTPLIDHKLMLCSVPSRAEALYLAAVINSTPIQDLLASFANTTAVSPTTLRRLPIPAFDQEQQQVIDLCTLADLVLTDPDPAARADDERQNLDDLVLAVLDSDARVYQPQARAARRARKVKKPEALDADSLF